MTFLLHELTSIPGKGGHILNIRTYIDPGEGRNFRPGSNEDVFGFDGLDGPVLLRDVNLVRIRYTTVTVRSPHLKYT